MFFQILKACMGTWRGILCIMWLTATASLWVTPLHWLLLTAYTPCRTHTSPPEGRDRTRWEAVPPPHSAMHSGNLFCLQSALVVKKMDGKLWERDVGTLWCHAIYHIHLLKKLYYTTASVALQSLCTVYTVCKSCMHDSAGPLQIMRVLLHLFM